MEPDTAINPILLFIGMAMVPATIFLIIALYRLSILTGQAMQYVAKYSRRRLFRWATGTAWKREA